jgi:hypothetical protein
MAAEVDLPPPGSTSGTPPLSEEQVAAYERDGYLGLPGYVGGEWLARLQAAAARWVEESRSLTRSDSRFDLEPGHCAERPRLRRFTAPVDHDPDVAAFALSGPAAELAVALLGAPARFHHSKLNFKWSDGGTAVDWHQDIQYWPHTDFTPLTIGVYLADVDDEMGPWASCREATGASSSTCTALTAAGADRCGPRTSTGWSCRGWTTWVGRRAR